MKIKSVCMHAWLACVLVLAGCCDKAALERCRADALAKLKLLDRPSIESQGLMRFNVRSIAAATVEVGVAKASCVSGKGGAAEVEVSWNVSLPTVRGVRARVGTGSNADKVWMESGPAGGGVTGPWIQDGSIIELRDSFGGGILAEIRVLGLPCGGP